MQQSGPNQNTAPSDDPDWKRESQSIFDADRFRHAGTLRKDNLTMKVEYSCCAGLDVHKRLVAACVLKGEPGQEPVSEIKGFGTTASELMEMVEWLKGHGVTHAAMEATGNFKSWPSWPSVGCALRFPSWRRL